MTHLLLLTLASVAAGAIAAISGFGIGSILTPLLATWVGTKLAVALASIPHLVGTSIRFLVIRQHLNRDVLWSFGVTSAIGGLAGAVLHIWLHSGALSYVLGLLLIFAGVMGITGLSTRMRFGRRMGLIAGAFSGLFGGLVGNQGGIRSAALLGFDLQRDEFIATATAIALLVDFFRIPVYAVTQWHDIAAEWELILVTTLAVAIGTLSGKWLLSRIPQNTFRKIVAGIILALGVWILVHPGT
jgi:uncharacterized protein